MNDYISQGVRLALLSRSKKLSFDSMEYEFAYTESRLKASFDCPKLQEEEIKNLCIYINQNLELGRFSNKQNIIKFKETVFDNLPSDKLSMYFTINAVNKFLKLLESYILAFDHKYLRDFKMNKGSLDGICKYFSNLAKVHKSDIFCEIKYDDEDMFNKDIELIQGILEIDEGLIRNHFPKIEIDISGRIKFITPRNFDSVKMPLSNYFSITPEQNKVAHNFIEDLSKKGIFVKKLSTFNKSVYFDEEKVFIFPKKFISEFITLNPSESAFKNEKCYNQGDPNNALLSFRNQKYLHKNKAIRYFKIKKVDLDSYILMHREINYSPADCHFICFYGIIMKSNKFFAVFEKYEIEAFGNSFTDRENSSRLSLLNNSLLVVIKTMTRDLQESRKYYYTIRINNLSFVYNNLKILPSMKAPDDFTQVSPEELFAMVVYYNQTYFNVLNLLFHFNDFSNHLGKAFKYEFMTRPCNKNISTIKKKINKLVGDVQVSYSVDLIYDLYLKVIEKIVDNLVQDLNLSNYELISQDFKEECFKVKKIIIRCKVLSKSPEILSEIIKIIEPEQNLVSKQPNLRNKYALGNSVSLSQDLSFDEDDFSMEFIRKENLQSVIEAESKSSTWNFPKSFSPNVKKFIKIAENTKKRYWNDFVDAKNFCENLLNIKVKNLCEKEDITESSSNVFIFGRVLYRMLFEEKNKSINERLISVKNNFSKYLKIVLTRRVFYNFEKRDQIDLSKYCNLCRMTMNYTISQRPTFSQIKELLRK